MSVSQPVDKIALGYGSYAEVQVSGTAPFRITVLQGGPLEFRQVGTNRYHITAPVNAALGTARYELVDANNERATGSIQILPAVIVYGPSTRVNVGQIITVGLYGNPSNAAP